MTLDCIYRDKWVNAEQRIQQCGTKTWQTCVKFVSTTVQICLLKNSMFNVNQLCFFQVANQSILIYICFFVCLFCLQFAFCVFERQLYWRECFALRLSLRIWMRWYCDTRKAYAPVWLYTASVIRGRRE